MHKFFGFGFLLPIFSIVPVNQEMSSKVSGFIKNFNIDKKRFLDQCGFAVIEFKDGLPELIGPFNPVKDFEAKPIHMVHSEVQCIREIKKQIKGKEKIIKTMYIFTKYSPCLDRNVCECCMSQLMKFSEEMYSTYNIKVVIAFQDFYGASGNIVEELKVLIKVEDPLIKNTLQRLKEKMNEQHRRSTFTCFHGNRKRIDTSRIIKDHIKTQIKSILNGRDVSFILGFEIKFSTKKKTLHEFKNYGEDQADELKRHMKNLNVSEEITEKVCSLFHSQWCELVYKEYEEFIYKKISDYINAVALEAIKAITNPDGFNVIRVKLTS